MRPDPGVALPTGVDLADAFHTRPQLEVATVEPGFDAPRLTLSRAVFPRGAGNVEASGLWGYTEPDGKTPKDLDQFNGHTTSLGYHYHATKNYPYINGGFHGEVTDRDGQVDPQPRAQSPRPAMPPLALTCSTASSMPFL